MSVVSKVVREDVLSMSAYHVPSSAGMLKLDAMENPYGLPQALGAELSRLVAEIPLNRYPDPQAPGLKARLRKSMQIPDEFQILLGNGSDELIQVMIVACARGGATVMAPGPTFGMYRQYALLAGVHYVGVPLQKDFSLDEAAMLQAMKDSPPAILFLSYPNNPTGNLFDESAMERIIEAAPGLVVVDEAYQPFADTTFMDRLQRFPNLVVLRTVSKLGLAGIRLGYAIGHPDWLGEFDKVRSPYNVNSLTQSVAELVLGHHDVLEQQAVQIKSERARLEMALAGMPGTRSYPSRANFVLARVPDATGVCSGLQRAGILIKNLHGMHPLLENCIRVTVGTPAENDRLLSVLAVLLGTSSNGAAATIRVV
jgi:histidinol-phosphate aminotransferase